jgi:hypothetical protein
MGSLIFGLFPQIITPLGGLPFQDLKFGDSEKLGYLNDFVNDLALVKLLTHQICFW